MLLPYINDLERILPNGTYIDNISSVSGNLSFEVFADCKEDAADFIVQMNNLDYVSDLSIVTITDAGIPDFEAPEAEEIAG